MISYCGTSYFNTTLKLGENKMYGSIAYDVPQHRRNLYSKIRSQFRRQAIMQTWSQYLIPWGKAEALVNVIKGCNMDKDGTPLPVRDHVRYSLFKFDSEVSGPALMESAKEALRKLISTAKSQLNIKINQA